MAATEVRSLGAYVEEMCSLRRDAWMYEFWFRGHADTRWALAPGMLRPNKLVVDWPNRNQSVTASNGKRFTIPLAAKPALLDELRAVGVTCATLYPDLDHVAKELRCRLGVGPTA